MTLLSKSNFKIRGDWINPNFDHNFYQDVFRIIDLYSDGDFDLGLTISFRNTPPAILTTVNSTIYKLSSNCDDEFYVSHHFDFLVNDWAMNVDSVLDLALPAVRRLFKTNIDKLNKLI